MVNFSHAQGTLIGVQLAHAGRKASTQAPWVHSRLGHGQSWVATEDQNGWPDNGMLRASFTGVPGDLICALVWGPSPLKFSETFPQPKEMDEEHIQYVEDWWLKSVERSKQAGCASPYLILDTIRGTLNFMFS